MKRPAFWRGVSLSFGVRYPDGLSGERRELGGGCRLMRRFPTFTGTTGGGPSPDPSRSSDSCQDDKGMGSRIRGKDERGDGRTCVKFTYAVVGFVRPYGVGIGACVRNVRLRGRRRTQNAPPKGGAFQSRVLSQSGSGRADGNSIQVLHPQGQTIEPIPSPQFFPRAGRDFGKFTRCHVDLFEFDYVASHGQPWLGWCVAAETAPRDNRRQSDQMKEYDQSDLSPV